MKVDKMRKGMEKRFRATLPEDCPTVITDQQLRNTYKSAFRATSMKALERYEEKHNIIFCRACIGTDNQTDKFAAYRCYISQEDNILENDGTWARIQCFHCNFDLRFDKPRPRQADPMDSMRYAIEKMQEQGMPPDVMQRYVEEAIHRQVGHDPRYQQERDRANRIMQAQGAMSDPRTSIQGSFGAGYRDGLFGGRGR